MVGNQTQIDEFEMAFQADEGDGKITGGKNVKKASK
jgi:hypothetical protein